jgi:hypothetical protein
MKTADLMENRNENYKKEVWKDAAETKNKGDSIHLFICINFIIKQKQVQTWAESMQWVGAREVRTTIDQKIAIWNNLNFLINQSFNVLHAREPHRYQFSTFNIHIYPQLL